MPSNFLIFDTGVKNLLSDADYASNVDRLNGVVKGQASSVLFNKAMRQASMGSWVLSNYLSDLGLTISDSNPNGFLNAFKSSVSTIKSITAKSANYTALLADRGQAFNCTGTFTFSFSAAATLGNGWYCLIRNDGTGVITLDPNGTETVDNLPTIRVNPGEGIIISSDGSNLKTFGRQYAPTGFLYGLTLSNNGANQNTAIDVQAGSCRSDDDTSNLYLPGVFTKSISGVWTSGTTNGGLDTGTAGGNSTYHVYLIQNTTTGNTDILFSASATSPALPSGYSAKRRIGAVVTDASGNIILFQQIGDYFWFKTPVQDVSAGTLTTPALIPLSVPTGIKARALFNARTARNNSAIYAYFSDPDNATITTPSDAVFSIVASAATDGIGSGNLEVSTNTSGQIRGAAAAPTNYWLVTLGYVDTRGRMG